MVHAQISLLRLLAEKAYRSSWPRRSRRAAGLPVQQKPFNCFDNFAARVAPNVRLVDLTVVISCRGNSSFSKIGEKRRCYSYIAKRCLDTQCYLLFLRCPSFFSLKGSMDTHSQSGTTLLLRSRVWCWGSELSHWPQSKEPSGSPAASEDSVAFNNAIMSTILGPSPDARSPPPSP